MVEEDAIENVIDTFHASDKAFKVMLLLITLTGFVLTAQQLDIQNAQLKMQMEMNAPIMGWAQTLCPKIEGGTGSSQLTIMNEGNSPLPFKFKISGTDMKVKLEKVGICDEFVPECGYSVMGKQGAFYVGSKSTKAFDYTVQVAGAVPKFSITLTDLFRNATATALNCEYMQTVDGWSAK